MNPPDGIADIEFFENREGELVFGEINARRPGDLLNPTYLLNVGIDFESAKTTFSFLRIRLEKIVHRESFKMKTIFDLLLAGEI